MAARSLSLPRFQRPSRSTLREWGAGYFFASPFIIGFLLFTAYPMFYSIWLSFQKWDLLTPPKYIGFANFVRMIKDPLANLSLYNSAYYTFRAVPSQLVISFALALALTQPIRFRDLYRAGFYLPIIVPLVAGMGRLMGGPVMLHCTNPPVPLAELLALLRPGDIVSHFLHGRGSGILDGLIRTHREARSDPVNDGAARERIYSM